MTDHKIFQNRLKAERKQSQQVAADKVAVARERRRIKKEKKIFNNRKQQATSLQQLRHEGNRANERCRFLDSENKQLAQELDRTKKRYDVITISAQITSHY